MKYNQDVLDTIIGYTPGHLSDRADCGYPYGLEAERFLTSVRDSVIEAAESIAAEDWEREMVDDYSGSAHEIADNAPSIYTTTKWEQFVGLSAFHEDPTELGFDGGDMEEGAGICLFLIASRLVSALAQEILEGITESEEPDEGEEA